MLASGKQREEGAPPLSQSAGGLDAALDAAGVGTWKVDPASGAAWLSAASSAITGFPKVARDVALQTLLDMIDPRDRRNVLIQLQVAILSGAFSAEYRVRQPGDGERWVRATGRTERDSHGGERITGVILDITDEVSARGYITAADERLRLVQHATGIGFFEVSADGVTHPTEECCRLLGVPPDQRSIVRDEVLAIVHAEDREKTRLTFADSLKGGGDSIEAVYRIIRPNDQAERWVLNRTKIHRDALGGVERLVGALLDITDRRRAEIELLEMKAMSHGIVASTSDSIAVLDADGNFCHMNASGMRMIEIESIERYVGLPWAGFWPEASRAEAQAAVLAAKSGRSARFDADTMNGKGEAMSFDVAITPIRDPAGRVSQIVTIARDITEQRRSRAKLEWAASHDFLTELPNRKYLNDRLAAALAGSERGQASGALLLIDLDQFKEVNDLLGHAAGDALLQCVASRLTARIGPNDLAARLGGDEFAVLLPAVGSEDAVRAFVADLHELLADPLEYEGRTIDFRVSIGAALYPRDGSDPVTLLRNADIALYDAKGEGPGILSIFQPQHRGRLQERLSMTSLARVALRDDTILPFYQPIFALDSGRLAGMEALLRWRNSRGDIQPPALIAAAFEDAELARAIGNVMQEKVAADLQQWMQAGYDFGRISINAAAPEFRFDDFAESLLERLDRARIPLKTIIVEITEGVLMGPHGRKVARALRLLHSHGVGIALDDFGTGFSSLSHIKDFPVDVLKIDRSFITNLQEGTDTAIIRAVLNLGRSLGVRVVAEGIETEAQAQYLREQECGYGQGYLYGRPVGFADSTELLAKRPA
ncbi:MAG: gmr 4 [Sphingomonas bacterium]|nr:gmr 4 [Sphingomonas bacterium]